MYTYYFTDRIKSFPNKHFSQVEQMLTGIVWPRPSKVSLTSSVSKWLKIPNLLINLSSQSIELSIIIFFSVPKESNQTKINIG